MVQALGLSVPCALEKSLREKKTVGSATIVVRPLWPSSKNSRSQLVYYDVLPG